MYMIIHTHQVLVKIPYVLVEMIQITFIKGESTKKKVYIFLCCLTFNIQHLQMYFFDSAKNITIKAL